MCYGSMKTRVVEVVGIALKVRFELSSFFLVNIILPCWLSVALFTASSFLLCHLALNLFCFHRARDSRLQIRSELSLYQLDLNAS